MLLSIAEVRACITTALDDTTLAVVIEREESAATARFGSPGDGVTTRTEIVRGHSNSKYIFPSQTILTVTSIEEQHAAGAAYAAVLATEYTVEPTTIERRSPWAQRVKVTYIAADTRPRWKTVLIEIIRQALEQTALKSESVAGEYAYQSPEWEAQRVRLYQRLKFVSI